MATPLSVNVRQYTDRLAGSSLPHSRELFMALREMQNWANRISQKVKSLEESTATSGTGTTIAGAAQGLAIKPTIELMGDHVLASPPDADDTLLIYVFHQDVTGGWQVTFPAAFKEPQQPWPDANTYTIMPWVKKSSSLILPATVFPKGIVP